MTAFVRSPEVLCVGAPSVAPRERFLELAGEIFDRRQMTNNGPVVVALERRLCEITGTRHCIPVCNATTGLMVALRALEVQGEVIVPSFTFPATPHAVSWLGLEVVFADVDPCTHQLDAASVRDQLTARTGAIMPVHLWGGAGDVQALQMVGDAAGVPLIYDAAHAFGARHALGPVGSFGRCEVFSFHATKFVSTFEGGAIATDDDALAERIRLLINFGLAGRDQVEMVGINAKLSEIHAAMGLASLELLDEFLEANRATQARYAVGLAGLRGLRLVTGHDPGSNGQYVVAEIDADQAGVTRDELLAELQHHLIDARRYFSPGCHRMAPYAERGRAACLPVTDALCERVLQLPGGAAVGPDDVERVCAVMRGRLGS